MTPAFFVTGCPRVSAVKYEAEALGSEVEGAARIKNKIDDNFRL